MHRRFVAALLLAMFAAFWASSPAASADKAAGPIKVFVSILPVAYFVERIGGPSVEVGVLVGPGQDPHTFEPSPKLMAKLAKAHVLFKLGFPFEETLIKKVGSAFKDIEFVDLQQGIKLRPVTEHEGHDRGHAEKHGHAHEAGGLDPHTWLDPQLAKAQAGTIAETLIRIDPSHRKDYEKNLRDLLDDLDAVNEQLIEALAPVKGKSFFVFHPAYGYLADAYGLKQVAVQLEGKEATARQLARLITLAKEKDVRVIFVQPQFSRKSAEALASAIGAAVIPLDDLAPDYLKNLRDMAAKLESALQSQKK